MEVGTKDLKSGDNIDGFEIVRKIAEGGMGAIYEAVHLIHGRVALKIMLPQARADLDLEARARFAREVEMCRSVERHPNAVHYLYDGQVGGRPFLVTELLFGVTLQELILKVKDLSFRDRLEIAKQLGRVLSYSHNLSFIHRDLKPENIFLLEGRQGLPDWVRLLDFGISKNLGQDSALTKVGQFCGTLQWMAPEQFGGSTSFTSDVFCLGLVLYFVFTGKYPMLEAEDALKAMSERAQLKSLPLSVAEIDPRVAAIIAKAVAFEPTDRFETASDLLHHLELIEEGTRDSPSEPLRLRSLVPTAVFHREGYVATQAMGDVIIPHLPGDTKPGPTVWAPPPPVDQETSPTPPRRPSLVLLGAVVALIVMGGFFFRRSEPPVEPPLVTPITMIGEDAGPLSYDASTEDVSPVVTASPPTSHHRSPPRGITVENDGSITIPNDRAWNAMSDRERARACHWLLRRSPNAPLTQTRCRPQPASSNNGFPPSQGGYDGTWGR